MKHLTFPALALSALLLGGCAHNGLERAGISAAQSLIFGHGASKNVSLPAHPITRGDALKGEAQALPAALNGLTHPAALGTAAISQALSEKKKAENEAAFRRLQNSGLFGSDDAIKAQIVRSYNAKHGTRFSTYEEVIDHARRTQGAQ